MTETQNQSHTPETKVITDVSDPSLSFSDFQKLRRGEKVEVTSAPVEKPEQKETKDSEPLEAEARDNEVDSDESDEAEESGKDKGKKKGGFQRKIDKMTARQKAAEQEIEYWKSQALKAPNDQKKEEPAKQAVTKSDDAEPSPDDFETHKEYINALTDWKLDQREKKAKIEADKKNFLSEQEKVFKAYHERKNAFAKTVDDFDEVLDDAKDVPITPAIQAAILESDFGPQVAYELAKNRAEFERIVKLGPLSAAREIGKIEARIALKASEQKETKETKKTTSAPKPIEPVGGTKGTALRQLDDPELTFVEYVERRRAQMKRR